MGLFSSVTLQIMFGRVHHFIYELTLFINSLYLRTHVLIYLTHRWNPNKDATTPGQSGSGSHGNEGILYTPQGSRTGTSPPDAV